MAKPDSQVAPVDPPAKKSGSMTLLKVIAFVSVIVLLEVAAASMMIPTSEETKDLAEKVAAADAAQELGDQGEVATEDSEAETLALADMLEVSLGSFHVLTYNPDSGSSLNIDFELFGTVLNEEESEFYLLYDAHQRRIREQILIAIRGVEMTDLTDAGLGLIKRMILEKSNRALGKPLLHEAIFSRFSFEER